MQENPKWPSSVFTIPSAAKLQRRWENIWPKRYLRAILPERKLDRRQSR